MILRRLIHGRRVSFGPQLTGGRFLTKIISLRRKKKVIIQGTHVVIAARIPESDTGPGPNTMVDELGLI